ncbi:DUF839 domain-containing protein [Synechocystis sp. LEGE 06083]|uniref:PhoX family protein n=2 Tax=Synechocystis TaxID=1142 RepID=UPI00187FC6B8|nr:alkaline phosphatase PhoX [Synechocystis sp. LEGE 06083]MBE9194410.1 DUF839 domain-containing protein [Synechocystis sp. LEGE 06083]
MVWSRRNFLAVMGLGAGAALFNPRQYPLTAAIPKIGDRHGDLSFQPIDYPIPLATDGLTPTQQKTAFATFAVQDELVLPSDFVYTVLGQWGDPVGDHWFGFNNDYLGLVETDENTAYLLINFEYISFIPWRQGYGTAIGKSLPIETVLTAAEAQGGKINAFALAADNPVKIDIEALCKAALVDQGMGVIRLERNGQGDWQRSPNAMDRRITGLSGLTDSHYLTATGPAIAIFTNPTKQGYDDGLGEKIIGTFGNCAGGTTPWGTVLSAEENFQSQVPEAVYADGSAVDPAQCPLKISASGLSGQGNVFGLAGNKYGWMVEIDPANANDYGTKHTALGRFRHEAVAVRATANQPLAVYSGCDRNGGHLYKFVSAETVKSPTDKSNSRLFTAGTLYGAKFHADGTGEWIALTPDTVVNPVRPSDIAVDSSTTGIVYLPHPDRNQSGAIAIDTDHAVAEYQTQFATLTDLYPIESDHQQGAILVDAHLAANAAGVTPTARPEDTEILPDGSVLIAFTSGWPSQGDGGCDRHIFQGPQGEVPYDSGWIMRLQETGDRCDALTFGWAMIAAGGEPGQGGLGFANPDNLAIDGQGDLWMVTDMSTSKHNRGFERKADTTSLDSVGVFGNNSLWYLPLHGPNAGQVFPFAIGPMDSELTGPVFSQDQKTLFLAVQHPGELNGLRQTEIVTMPLTTTNGEPFLQTRTVPLQSHWPNGGDMPSRPAVVTIQRRTRQPFHSS